MANSMIPWLSFGVFVGGTSMEKPDPTKVAAPTKFVADIVDHEHQVVPRPSEKNVALRRDPNANQKKESWPHSPLGLAVHTGLSHLHSSL